MMLNILIACVSNAFAYLFPEASIWRSLNRVIGANMAVRITDTTLRDAHQSLIATRMRTKDMLGIVEEMDKVGFFSLEVWGGATFDTAIRFLNEDPWERLREIRKRAKKTKLQMLLRGQNLVGYRHYSDDIVEEFVRLSVKNGIDIFRVFDALNDVRNMEYPINVANSYKAHVQGTICYTTSPVHSIESFSQTAVELEQLGCESICIKDMAGLITPAAAADLVKGIKKRVHIPVDLHSHCSSGMAPMSYYAAVLAGVDVLDTAFSPFAWGTSQPPTESTAAALKDTPYDTGLDLKILYEIGEQFAGLVPKYSSLLTSEATRPSINVLLHQIPGGMISNLVSQLREQQSLDKLGAVLEEVPKVRADLGYPPLVTPTSQLVGIQAVLNVMNGERYKKVTKEVKDYLLGYYGRPPGQINPEIKKQIVGDLPSIEGRPADLLEPEYEKLKDEARKMGLIKQEEDAMTYALYPQVAAKFLKGEAKEEIIQPVKGTTPPEAAQTPSPSEFSVDVDGEVFNVKVSAVAGKTVEVEKASKTTAGSYTSQGSIPAPMSGMVLSIKVKIGDKVNEGDLLALIEAMKMQNEVHSPHSGTVKEIRSYESEVISVGDIIMVVEPG
jgi:pyruvate carboxylase subunit B